MKLLPLLALFAIGSPALAQDRIVTVKTKGGTFPYHYYTTRYYNCTKNEVKSVMTSPASVIPVVKDWESPDDYTGEFRAMGQAMMDHHCK